MLFWSFCVCFGLFYSVLLPFGGVLEAFYSCLEGFGKRFWRQFIGVLLILWCLWEMFYSCFTVFCYGLSPRT